MWYRETWQGYQITQAAAGYGTVLSCFFFQAEDGIRDVAVTGVQTCALPISREADLDEGHAEPGRDPGRALNGGFVARVPQRGAHRPRRPDDLSDRREYVRSHGTQRAAAGLFRIDDVGPALEGGARFARVRDTHQKPHTRPLPCGSPKSAGRLGRWRPDVKTAAGRCDARR